MIQTTYIDGKIKSAKSDDGRVWAKAVPLTSLHGSFELIDTMSGRPMWRGLYPDADGFYRADKVPGDVWNAAVSLMNEVGDVIKAQDDASQKAADAAAEARYSPLAEEITRKMDDPYSDL